MLDMEPDPAWARIDAELDYAKKVREQGNEGMARVCARRAAGWAIGIYQINQLGMDHANHSAYQLLKWFQTRDQFPRQDREAAARLTTQINEAHELPHPEDPIADAQQIITSLRDSSHGISAT